MHIPMKSIGIFWKSDKDEEDYCSKCPHHKSNTSQKKDSGKSDEKGFEFQMNLWNSEVKSLITGHQYRFRAIDFGVICPLSTTKLVFLLPFKADLSDFHDLVKCLSLDTDLLCTVFNEDLKSTSEPAKSYQIITGEKIHLLMYELSKENIEDFRYDEQANVTQIKININSDFNASQFQDCRLFVRFRINLQSLDSFAKKKKVSNDWLQSAFSSTYMFDIRLNDVREMSKKKKELVEFNGFKLPNFDKVHFFYMADSEENVENGSSLKLDKRLLENERWHSYLGDSVQFVSENIAHHWKCKKDVKFGLKKVDTNGQQNMNLQIQQIPQNISNFTLFFKTEFSDCQRKRLLFYLLIVTLLGAVASAVVAFIDSFIPCGFLYSWGIWMGSILLLVIVLYFCLRKSVKA